MRGATFAGIGFGLLILMGIGAFDDAEARGRKLRCDFRGKYADGRRFDFFATYYRQRGPDYFTGTYRGRDGTISDMRGNASRGTWTIRERVLNGRMKGQRCFYNGSGNYERGRLVIRGTMTCRGPGRFRSPRPLGFRLKGTCR